MNDDILDTQALFNPDNLDSKTRIKISDAIIEVNDQVKKVRWGRYFLFSLAAFNFFLPVLSLLTSDEVPPQILYTTIAGVAIVVLPFIVFGILYPKKPLLFLILGLLVYLAFEILASVFLGVGILDGYQAKVATITFIGFAIYSVFLWKSNLNKLLKLGYPTSVVAEAQKKLKPIPRLKKRKKTTD